MTQAPSRRGYTLLELIVVLAIIIVAAVIFMPLPNRSPEISRKSACQNNLKQIVLAFKQYQHDFDERYPLVAVTDATTKEGVPPYGWADAVQPYIRNTQVYQCPSDDSDGLADGDPTASANYTDYWYNANFIVRSRNKAEVVIYTGVKESYLGSPSQTVIAGEGGSPTGAPTGNARFNQCGDGTSINGRNRVCGPLTTLFASSALAIFPNAKIHLDGANFAYADGHVKWLRGNNASQSAQILSNAATHKSIGGKSTFSLLNK